MGHTAQKYRIKGYSHSVTAAGGRLVKRASVLCLFALLVACNSSGLNTVADKEIAVAEKGTHPTKKEDIIQTGGQRGEPVILRGMAHYRGDAVRCPEIKTASGDIVGVSAIPNNINLGTEIEVSGAYGYMTSCKGKVVIVETLKQI